MTRWTYVFADGKADGSGSDKQLLGGKGANLAEMTRIGLPVPPGFTVTTTACKAYQTENKLPDGLMDEVKEHLANLEKLMGQKFGGEEDPLFVSVRSGAAVSMPGMMDTVLNLGMNEKSLAAFIAKTGNERLGWDSYRRFINMFGNVVMGVEHEHFEEQMTALKEEVGVKLDTDFALEGAHMRLEVLVLHAHDDVTEHVDEATVGIPAEALVAGLGDERGQ